MLRPFWMARSRPGTCDHPNGDQRNIFQKMFGLGEKGYRSAVDLSAARKRGAAQSSAWKQSGECTEWRRQNQAEPEKKKKGFFGKIFGVFKDDDKNKDQTPNQSQPPQQ